MQGVSWDPLGRYVATQSNDRCGGRRLPPSGAATDPPPASPRVRVAPRRRSARVYQIETKKSGALAFAPVARLHRAPAPPGAEPPAAGVESASAPDMQPMLFLSESIHQSFFRRLAWSPDGGVLVLPSGQTVAGATVASAVFVHTRANLSRSVARARARARAAARRPG